MRITARAVTGATGISLLNYGVDPAGIKCDRDLIYGRPVFHMSKSCEGMVGSLPERYDLLVRYLIGKAVRMDEPCTYSVGRNRCLKVGGKTYMERDGFVYIQDEG